MKKIEIIVYCSFVLFLIIDSTGLAAESLVELYKKKEIFLEEDVEFGKDNDWEELFYDVYKSLVIGPDGNIYVINTHQHNVFQFSKDGIFLKKARGPVADFITSLAKTASNIWLRRLFDSVYPGLHAG